MSLFEVLVLIAIGSVVLAWLMGQYLRHGGFRMGYLYWRFRREATRTGDVRSAWEKWIERSR